MIAISNNNYYQYIIQYLSFRYFIILDSIYYQSIIIRYQSIRAVGVVYSIGKYYYYSIYIYEVNTISSSLILLYYSYYYNTIIIRLLLYYNITG